MLISRLLDLVNAVESEILSIVFHCLQIHQFQYLNLKMEIRN